MNTLENRTKQKIVPIDKIEDDFFFEDIKFRGLAEHITATIELFFLDDKHSLQTPAERLDLLKGCILKMETLTQYIRRQNEGKYKLIQDIEALTARCRNMEDLIFEKQTI